MFNQKKTIMETMYVTIRIDYSCNGDVCREDAKRIAESMVIDAANFFSGDEVNGVYVESVESYGENK